MSYLTLKKYGYIHHGDSHNEYLRRFNSYDAKKIGIGVASYPAFFVETKEIRHKVLQIYKLDKEVIKLCSKLPSGAVADYMMKCLFDEIEITNSIEGIQSTRKELQAAYDNKGTRFKGIVDKYLMLMTSDTLSLDSCQDLRDLYDELVLPEVLEESDKNMPDGILFRKNKVFVDGNKMEHVHEGLYPEEQIIKTMSEAIAYLNSDEELLYRVSVFHYLLGYIHPFYDGNGRLNRFISSYMLISELNPIIGYRLSYTVKATQAAYYKAFVECNDKANFGELTVFIDMFLTILLESMENLVTALNKRKALWDKYDSMTDRLPYSQMKKYPDLYRELILTELFASTGMTIKDLKDKVGVSEPTLRKMLGNIADSGLLHIDASGHSYIYGIDLRRLDDLITQKD